MDLVPRLRLSCYPVGMKGKPRKALPRDPVKRAKAVFDQAVGDVRLDESQVLKQAPVRAKGGSARAAALDPDRRAEIARIAANARWKKSKAKEPPEPAD